jgi:ABC-type transport system substrate-binding protein
VNSAAVGVPALFNGATGRIPSPSNRWSGGNRGGWSNQEYDRLLDVFAVTLDQGDRERHVTEMVRMFTEDVGAISLSFRVQPSVFSHRLKGVSPSVASEALVAWNIHEWQFN